MVHTLLPIATDHHATTYLHHAFPLAVLLTEERLRPWFLERFVQLVAATYVDDDGRVELWLDLAEREHAYSEVLVEIPLDLRLAGPVDSVIDILRGHVDAGFYPVILLDEYHLPQKRCHQDHHFVHPTLVHGYDDGGRRLATLGFDRHMRFGPIILGYDDVASAWRAATDAVERGDVVPPKHRGVITLLRPRPFRSAYPFDLRRFTDRLGGYLDAELDSAEAYFGHACQLGPAAWSDPGAPQVRSGMDVYDVLDIHLELLTEGRLTMDYRHMQVLHQHKLLLHERLSVIAAGHPDGGALTTPLREYSKWMRRIDTARLLFLKTTVDPRVNMMKLRDRTDTIAVDRAGIDDIRRTLRAAQRSERELLGQVHRELHRMRHAPTPTVHARPDSPLKSLEDTSPHG